MKTSKILRENNATLFSELDTFEYFMVNNNIYVKLPVINNACLGTNNAYDFTNDCLTYFKDSDDRCVKKIACELRWWEI